MNRASDRIGWHGSWKASSQCADATQIAEMMVEDFGAVPTVDGTPGLIGIMSQHDVLASFENNRTCRSADVGKRRGEGHMVRISIRWNRMPISQRSSCVSGQQLNSRAGAGR